MTVCCVVLAYLDEKGRLLADSFENNVRDVAKSLPIAADARLAILVVISPYEPIDPNLLGNFIHQRNDRYEHESYRKEGHNAHHIGIRIRRS